MLTGIYEGEQKKGKERAPLSHIRMPVREAGGACYKKNEGSSRKLQALRWIQPHTGALEPRPMVPSAAQVAQ